jgi:hypothetical protein
MANKNNGGKSAKTMQRLASRQAHYEMLSKKNLLMLNERKPGSCKGGCGVECPRKSGRHNYTKITESFRKQGGYGKDVTVKPVVRNVIGQAIA